jgi:hypothetical protein
MPKSSAGYGLALLLLVFIPFFESSAEVQISKFQDLGLGAWNGSGPLEAQNELCIYNSAGSDYVISAFGSGPGDSFSLSAAGGQQVPYEVRFRGDDAFVQLSAGEKAFFSGANSLSTSCGGGTNGTLRITATAESLASALSGSYSGSITLTLEAN